MKKKLFVILLGALSAVTLWAYNPLTGLPVSTGEVVLGEWNRNYPETLAMADSTHIPMVLVWASSECSNCQNFEQTVLASAEFKAWMAERQLIMSFGYDKGTQYGSSAAKAMAKNKSGKFPYVLVYWNKGDGSATVEGRFSGLSDWLPVRNAGSFIKNTIASIEQYIAEYTPGPGYTGGVFALSDSEGSHLEAAAGKASTVYVPLWRTNDVSEAATNYLEFDNAAKAKTRVTVKWAANEASKTVAINVPAAQAGKSFTLTLFDEDGSTEVATSSIAVVADPGNSVTNPYFVGEKSADELGFGEWTMDIDVATAKVAAAAGDAYTLLLFTGPLWCPDCIGAEEMFNSAEFIGWAADNQVALVEIDQALSGQDKPTLLGYGEFRGKSGAAYLSRKGIDPADAQEVFARNVELSLQPPYTRAWTTARNPNPHAVLLRKDGTVAGRWNINEDADRTTHFNKNIWQLKDLLLLAEDGDETTMYAYTTGLTYAINTIADTSLQVNENKRVYKLTGDLVGKRVKFTAEPATVEIAVLASADPTNFTQNVISSAAGELTVDFDGENTAGDVFVQLTAYPDGCTEVFSATTVEDVQLTSSMIIVPAEKSASYDLEDGETELTVETEKDAAYKLTGFGDVSAYFDYNSDEELYTAKVTGTVTLPVAGTSVTYQKWVPGTVGFTKEADQFIELDGAGSFTVSRSGGSSGALKVKVSLAEASERVVWGGDAVFEWADGESGEKSFEFEIVVNDEYEGETVLPFNLEVTEGAATVGIAAEAVTIYDRDEPTTSPKSFEESFFKGFTISQVYPIHNIRENPRRVTIKKASGTLPPGMTMKYDSKQQAMVFSGVPKAMGTYEFSYNITETRSDGAHTTTDPIAFAVEIRDPSDVNQFFGTSWNREVPVIDDEDHIAGMLTVTATKSNKVTAKFSGTESAPTQFSGGWSDLDEVSGTITASLKTRTGARLDITLSNTGEFSANIEGVENYFENLSCSAKIAGAADDMSAYKGYYTVQLPCADPDDVAVANGVGYLTLTFTSASAVKTGKVNYSGMLPNGQTVSGTASLSPSADMATLAIFRRAGHDVLGLALDIAPNAATTYSGNPQVIISSEDFEPYWLYRNGEIKEFAELEAFGGYYDPNDLLSDCCETVYFTNEFLLDTTSGPALTGSDKFGTVIGSASELVVVTANKIALAQRSSQISLTLNKRTGVFSGSVYVGGATGRVRAQYKGVLLPGWHDCGCYDFEGEFVERPLGAGTIYFTDKVGGLSVKRGLPVTIGLTEE